MGKIRFNASEVYKKLQALSIVAKDKKPSPIFNDILFVGTNRKLYMTASNGDTWLTVSCDLISQEDNFSTCIDATDITKSMSNISECECTAELNNSDNTVKFNYGNGKFSLPCNSPSDFPSQQTTINNCVSINIPVSDVIEAISYVKYAIGNNEVRQILNGIHFIIDTDGMTAVATDAKKMCVVKNNNITSDSQNEFTMSAKTTNALLSAVSENDNSVVNVSFTEQIVVVRNANFCLTASLIDGRYPNYKAVIPQDDHITINVNRKALYTAVVRTMPMGDIESELVRLDFANNILTVSTENYLMNKHAQEVVECDCGAVDFHIGLKGSFLMQCITSIKSDDVSLDFVDERKPVIIHPTDKTTDEYLSLLMPMMLN